MSKPNSFPDFPDLSRLPKTFANTTTPRIPHSDGIPPRINMPTDFSQSPTYTPDTLYIYEFLTSTKNAIEARTKYYDEVIESTEHIINAHKENSSMIRSLLWYSFICSIFIFISVILITILCVYLLSPTITIDNIPDLTKGITGLASFGIIAAFINLCFIRNFFNKFKETDSEIRHIKEDISKIKSTLS